MKGTKAKNKNEMYLLIIGVIVVAVIAIALLSQPAQDTQAAGGAATGDATDVLASGGGQPQEGTEPALDSAGGEIAE